MGSRGPGRGGGAHEGSGDAGLRRGNRIGRRIVKPDSWPRYMAEKRTRGGVAYYWRPPGRDVSNGCPVHAEPLGADFGGAVTRAQLLNEHLDSWRRGLSEPTDINLGAR